MEVIVPYIIEKETTHCKLITIDKEYLSMSFLPEGFKSTPVQDFEGSGEFEVMKGTAIGKLEKCERDQGEWPDGSVKDLINLQWRITENLSGNCHANRVVFKKYYMTDSDYSTGAENRAKLANDLCTAGYDMDLSNEAAFYGSLAGAAGITANLVLGKYNEKQTVRVVEKFAARKKDANTEVSTDEAPF